MFRKRFPPGANHRRALLMAGALLTGAVVLTPGVARADGFAVGNVLLSWPMAIVFALGAAMLPFYPGILLGRRWRAAPGGGEAHSLRHGVMAGLLIFLLVDLVGLTGNLGMGMSSPPLRLLLLLALLAGLGGAAWYHHQAGGVEAGVSGGPGADLSGLPAADRLAVIWAVGIGLHTLGEGFLLGANLTLGLGVALAPLPILSYVLHKLAEGLTVGALLSGARPTPLRLTLLAGLPAVVGVLGGFAKLGGAASPFAYGAGAGVLLYVLAQYFRAGRGLALWRGVMIGLTLMYLAGWIHELG